MNKGNAPAYELYNQFCLDIPRLDVYIDGRKYEGDSTSLFMNLWNTFKGVDDENEALSTDSSSIFRIPESFKLNISPLNAAWTMFQLTENGQSVPKESISPNGQAIRALNYCTQTALASWFQAGREQWCKHDQSLHLIDGGRQQIHVATTTGKKSITVQKPFRVVKMTDTSDPLYKSLVNLTITFDAERGKTENSWCIEECPSEDPLDTKTLNLDWVVIERFEVTQGMRNE